jgi:hypothetical protein
MNGSGWYAGLTPLGLLMPRLYRVRQIFRADKLGSVSQVGKPYSACPVDAWVLSSSADLQGRQTWFGGGRWASLTMPDPLIPGFYPVGRICVAAAPVLLK